MNKGWLVPLALSLLAGCATPVQRGSIPVVEAGRPVSAGGQQMRAPAAVTPQAAPQMQAQDSGVVVMVPQEVAAAPIQTFPGASSSAPLTTSGGLGASPSGVSAPAAPQAGSGAVTLAADERLDGPVLALLTSAQQMERSGNLAGASSSLERAQRIAPREPQVLYRLAEVRLAQGDPAQAEQLARRGLTYAGGRPALQASLWEVIAQARERQGDAAGAAQARQRAKVPL
ncbi:tetratricopeptide repeat protein [Pseudomonas oryzae]|uniref:Tetratricopeptide repeat-containing protein n=1 Tax=Pseudomonas oryzae TaxID=1392877 RepID=A0A1H1Z2B0_9PSED|nr:tetratricopeptide repeat protein [Pseudomonas oryzae]SDT27861.1 Tetratricopeptide repeat-containing protein [Pseudomonas oryzae]